MIVNKCEEDIVITKIVLGVISFVFKWRKAIIVVRMRHDAEYHGHRNFDAIYYGRSQTQQNCPPFTSVHK